jgi:transcriptional regulator with XRE-family HTH domain
VSARTELLLRELAASIREEVGQLPTGVEGLGAEIARARADARMSLDEVARAAGLTKSHVWELEQGRARNPTIRAVSGLATALGVPFLRLAQAAMNSSAKPIPVAGSRDDQKSTPQTEWGARR